MAEEERRGFGATVQQMSLGEAVFALIFIGVVIVLMYAVMAGTIANAITLGLMLLLGIGVVFLGNHLEKSGALSRPALMLYYVGAIGFVLIIYGAIKKGYLPIAIAYTSSLEAIAITNALLYVLFVVALFVVLYAIYEYIYLRKPLPRLY